MHDSTALIAAATALQFCTQKTKIFPPILIQHATVILQESLLYSLISEREAMYVST
jgi:hypothetical protein